MRASSTPPINLDMKETVKETTLCQEVLKYTGKSISLNEAKNILFALIVCNMDETP